MKENKDKIKALLIALAKWAEAELFCIVTFIFYAMVVTAMGRGAHILFAVVCFALVACLMADYALKLGYSATKGVKAGTLSECRNFGILIGLAAALPTYICFVFLALSANGMIGNFYPAFKIINSMFAPAVNIFASTADAKELTTGQLIGIGAIPLYIPIVTWIAYKLGYDDTDLAQKFVYKSKK